VNTRKPVAHFGPVTEAVHHCQVLRRKRLAAYVYIEVKYGNAFDALARRRSQHFLLAPIWLPLPSAQTQGVSRFAPRRLTDRLPLGAIADFTGKTVLE